jgi:hypothetical protein
VPDLATWLRRARPWIAESRAGAWAQPGNRVLRARLPSPVHASASGYSAEPALQGGTVGTAKWNEPSGLRHPARSAQRDWLLIRTLCTHDTSAGAWRQRSGGAGGGSRTHRSRSSTGCEPVAFASFATPAPIGSKPLATRRQMTLDTHLLPSRGGRIRQARASSIAIPLQLGPR